MELGPGVIILLITWLLTGLTWLLFLRSQSSVRAFVTAVAALLTVILILIPTESVHLKEWDRSHENFDVYDFLFIWKVILIVILTVSVLAALGILLTIIWTQKVHGSGPISKSKNPDWSTVSNVNELEPLSSPSPPISS